MTTLEDRLRAATQAAAQTVAPDSIPPLRLPDQPSRGPAARWRRKGGRRWAGWLVPLAAAIAVITVILGSLAISGVFYSRPSRGGSVSVSPDRVPPYYVALTFTGICCPPGGPFKPRTRAAVRATATGAVLATVVPPKPYGTFAGVVASHDDRTFVLAAQREKRPFGNLQAQPQIKFFLLRINPAGAPAGGRARLTPLPIPAGPAGAGNEIWNFALSPDATSLATLDTRGIHVFDLATGAERTWDIPVPGSAHRGTLGFLALSAGAANSMLAWAGDHTLAFAYYGGHRRGGASSGTGVRFLNTRAPGTNPLADSRLVVPQPKNSPDLGGYWRAILPTPDGRRVVAVLERTNGRLSQKLVEFSAGTGQVLRVLNHIPVDGTFEQVLWASPSGRSLLVTGTKPVSESPASRYMTNPGVLTGGHFRPVPWPGQNLGAAW